jgi:hypothetical protein
MNARKTVVLIPFLFLPCCCFAWGMLGHRIVGEIAEKYLTSKARAEIKKILGNESIAMVSNWADFIKSDSTYNYLNPWHYVNLDSGLTAKQSQTQLQNDTTTNLYNKILFLIKELKNKRLPMDKKRMYLKLLIHLVGDIHQPLHIGLKSNLGGNHIRVQWFNTPSNLHSVWDESLINFQQLSYTEYTAAINFTTAEQRRVWQKQPIIQWAVESYVIAETLYPEITEDNQRLSYRYNFLHIQTVNERLLKGGVRLAGLLNELFK